MAISQIPALKFIFHSYSESSTFGRPGLGRSTPIKWQFGRPSVGRSTLNQMAISQIPALTAHYFIPPQTIWQTRSWQIYPPSNGNFTDSCSTLRAHLFGRSTPTSNGNFTDSCEIHISFLLWELNIWQTRCWQIYPHSGNFTDSCSDDCLFHAALWDHLSFGRPGLQIYPPIKWWFHRFLLWQLIPTLRAQHLADQVLADLTPHIQWQFHRFLLWQLIPTLRAHHLADQVGRSTPPSNGNFTDCCCDNSYFIPTLTAQHLADQVLADLPPSSMAISQIPTLLWELIFGRPSVGRSTPTSNGNSTDPCAISFLL